jgi:hypothetical protein
VIKLFSFVRRSPPLKRADFAAAWLEEHGPVVADAPGLAGRLRRYLQSHAIPGAHVPELTFSEFDCVDTLAFDTVGDLTAALGGAGALARIDESAARFVDPARTIHLVAEESPQWDRGFGRVKFVGLSRRHPSLTHEEWCRYWVEVHGPLAHGVPEFTRYYGRYVHNYVLPHALASGGRAPEFDGIVEEWLESAEDMAACLAEPEYLRVVRPDEVRFVDFARSHMMLTEEHVVVDA